MHLQTRLFTREPALGSLSGVERHVPLPGSWIDVRRNWLAGDDSVFDELVRSTRWTESRRRMYDRIVDVPRLTAVLPQDGPGHPVLREAAEAISAHYDRPCHRVSLALYRSGRDSVALHGDKLGPDSEDCVVAILSLRGPRRFVVKHELEVGWSTLSWELGMGDLVVMGGRAQVDLQHGVPKVAQAPPRMSVMFRQLGGPASQSQDFGVQSSVTLRARSGSVK